MRWPLMWSSTHECQLAAALLRVQKIEDDFRQRLAEQDAKHAVQLAEAVAANRRLDGRNRALAEQLEAAQAAAGLDVAHARRMAQRITRLQQAVKAARAETAKARRAGPEAVVLELHRSEKARAALDSQIGDLQRSNEQMARELYDIRHGGDAS